MTLKEIYEFDSVGPNLLPRVVMQRQAGVNNARCLLPKEIKERLLGFAHVASPRWTLLVLDAFREAAGRPPADYHQFWRTTATQRV